ncbi:uncharacterized protein LOC108665071 [Hyalella azteca]|uniref:Uncharacterized protein LOC108665071 n=1 Tax=Hyalella azteca TaxID=294128 RepID=A0A8B7N0B6_HYAAZ|nr:uncharacterized protein LOC108665071 [Hyalella azteca]
MNFVGICLLTVVSVAVAIPLPEYDAPTLLWPPFYDELVDPESRDVPLLSLHFNPRLLSAPSAFRNRVPLAPPSYEPDLEDQDLPDVEEVNAVDLDPKDEHDQGELDSKTEAAPKAEEVKSRSRRQLNNPNLSLDTQSKRPRFDLNGGGYLNNNKDYGFGYSGGVGSLLWRSNNDRHSLGASVSGSGYHGRFGDFKFNQSPFRNPTYGVGYTYRF